MAVKKEDYFKIWNVCTFNGLNPPTMMNRVEHGTSIALCPGATLDEVRCVPSKFYSKKADDHWQTTSIKVGNDGGNAYLYCNIGPEDDRVEFRIDPDDLQKITCSIETLPSGTWSGDDT